MRFDRAFWSYRPRSLSTSSRRYGSSRSCSCCRKKNFVFKSIGNEVPRFQMLSTVADHALQVMNGAARLLHSWLKKNHSSIFSLVWNKIYCRSLPYPKRFKLRSFLGPCSQGRCSDTALDWSSMAAFKFSESRWLLERQVSRLDAEDDFAVPSMTNRLLTAFLKSHPRATISKHESFFAGTEVTEQYHMFEILVLNFFLKLLQQLT